MLIGAMNHPARPVLEEIEWMAAMGLDFIDLTLEPPLATVDHVDVPATQDLLAKRGLQAVGHTAYYLPFASPFESIRRLAQVHGEQCLIGAGTVINVADVERVGAHLVVRARQDVHPGDVEEQRRKRCLRRDLDRVGIDDTRGFGLSTMRARARALGGALSVESRPARGTTVEVVLP